MAGGTLVVSRAIILFPQMEQRFKELGFKNVTLTGVRLDGLNMVINNVDPSLLIIASDFYQAGTPYMVGEMHKLFPDKNMAVISLRDYPMRLAPWFIWHGAKSYVDLWEGYDEFHHGLRIVRDGGKYVSPKVKKIIDSEEEWPDTTNKVFTKRMQESLILLCCGYKSEEIGEELHIARKTVNRHLDRLYDIFHADNREEMVSIAWELELVTKEDIRFHRERPYNFKLPEWAVISKRINNKYQISNNKEKKVYAVANRE